MTPERQEAEGTTTAMAITVTHARNDGQQKIQKNKSKDGENDRASNLDRELVYNIEHAIHHMALIKIGIKEVAPQLQLPEGFGVANSTIRHKKQQKKISE